MKFTKEKFLELYNIDITELVDKDYKGLKYLSWATAWKLLQEQDETAEYEVLKDQFNMPFFSRDSVHFVYTKIKAFETTKEMYLPVMDNNHKSVAIPNSTQVNNAIQRCLAKNIAMFGIGLKLYVGEDLEEIIPQKQELKKETPAYTPEQMILIELAKTYKLTKDEMSEILGTNGFTSSAEVKKKDMENLINEINEYVKIKGGK